MTEPAPDSPTVEDLRRIAEFIRARSLDEASKAGHMDFYKQTGVTVQVRIPKALHGDLDDHRANVTGWLEEHSPHRFVDMAHELANLARGLADALAGVAVRDYYAGSAWRQLTGAARLWESHADFDPAWAKPDE